MQDVRYRMVVQVQIVETVSLLGSGKSLMTLYRSVVEIYSLLDSRSFM